MNQLQKSCQPSELVLVSLVKLVSLLGKARENLKPDEAWPDDEVAAHVSFGSGVGPKFGVGPKLGVGLRFEVGPKVGLGPPR